MSVVTEARAQRRARVRPLVQISVRIDAQVRARMQAEADAREVDLAVIAREHLESSVLGTGVEQRLGELGRHVEELLAVHRETGEADAGALRELVDTRLENLAHVLSTHDEQIAGLGKLFKSGFDNLADAFLKLQTFLEKGGAKK